MIKIDDGIYFEILDDEYVNIFQDDKVESPAKLSDFEPIKVIGKGGFGVVYLVRKKNNSKLYAMKQLRKDLIIKNKILEATRYEKDILKKVQHPFLVGMEYAFQTKLNIYFVINYYKGGALYKHLIDQKRFTEENAKFYAAQILLALGELHKNNVIYRDMKPENILLGEDGYVALTDFGLSKILEEQNQTATFCGTSEYVAPEIIRGEQYTNVVDWWGLGILLHEMIMGGPPFRNSNKFILYRDIKSKEVSFDRSFVKISDEAESIIKELLIKDPNKRLGSKNDAEEIIKHPFFATINLDKLTKKELPVEFKPIKDCDLEFYKVPVKFEVKDKELVEKVTKESMKLINSNMV